MSDTKNIRDEAVIIDDINQELIGLHSDNSDIAYSCKCGSVKWNLRKDSQIECIKCGYVFGKWSEL